jgi:hypothetical protein
VVNGDQLDEAASSAGAAYVFVRSNGVWMQQAYLKALNSGAGDQFGNSVSINANQLVVGAYREDNINTGINSDGSDDSAINAGAVYVFTRNLTSWTQSAYIKASNTGAGDQFGYRVSLDSDTLVVSANREGSAAFGIDGDQTDDSLSRSGAVYVFTLAGSVWTQQAYIKASNTADEAAFGSAIDIEGDTLVVGASGEGSAAVGIDGNQTYINSNFSGAAYVFNRSAETWLQSTYLKASNTDMDDAFGSFVSIKGNRIAVGATGESSESTGINGSPGNSAVEFVSGAVYLFENNAGWLQTAYIKASDVTAYDDFANVVLGDDYLVVGAALEDSAATGINGDDTDETAFDAGAVYIFSGDVIGE